MVYWVLIVLWVGTDHRVMRPFDTYKQCIYYRDAAIDGAQADNVYIMAGCFASYAV